MLGPFREWRKGMRPDSADENARNDAIEAAGRRTTGFQGLEGQGEHSYTAQYQLGRITGVVSKVQTLTVSGSAGTYKLSYGGATTTPIAYNGNAQDILTALALIMTAGTLVSVSGTNPFTITLVGPLPLITIDTSSLTGTATVTAAVPGWYSWVLLTTNEQIPSTDVYPEDELGFTGPDNNGDYAAHELNNNPNVPTDAAYGVGMGAVARVFPAAGGNWMEFSFKTYPPINDTITITIDVSQTALDIGPYALVRLIATVAGLSVYGIAGGYNGRRLTVWNCGDYAIYMRHTNNAANEADQIISSVGHDIALLPNCRMELEWFVEDDADVADGSAGSGNTIDGAWRMANRPSEHAVVKVLSEVADANNRYPAWVQTWDEDFEAWVIQWSVLVREINLRVPVALERYPALFVGPTSADVPTPVYQIRADCPCGSESGSGGGSGGDTCGGDGGVVLTACCAGKLPASFCGKWAESNLACLPIGSTFKFDYVGPSGTSLVWRADLSAFACFASNNNPNDTLLTKVELYYRNGSTIEECMVEKLLIYGVVNGVETVFRTVINGAHGGPYEFTGEYRCPCFDFSTLLFNIGGFSPPDYVRIEVTDNLSGCTGGGGGGTCPITSTELGTAWFHETGTTSLTIAGVTLVDTDMLLVECSTISDFSDGNAGTAPTATWNGNALTLDKTSYRSDVAGSGYLVKFTWRLNVAAGATGDIVVNNLHSGNAGDAGKCMTATAVHCLTHRTLDKSGSNNGYVAPAGMFHPTVYVTSTTSAAEYAHASFACNLLPNPSWTGLFAEAQQINTGGDVDLDLTQSDGRKVLSSTQTLVAVLSPSVLGAFPCAWIGHLLTYK